MFQKNWQELIKPGKLKTETGHDAGRIATITAAVEQGRLVYRNLKKLLLFLFVTSIDEVVVLLAAVVFFVLNKTDLLPYLDFDVEQCIANARRVNPAIEVVQVSARTGEGLDAWIDWLLEVQHAATV